MKQGDQDQGGRPGAEAGSSAVDALAERIGQAGGGEPQNQGDIDGQTGTKELTVDVGGVERVVKIDELVAAFRDREKATKALQTVQERMQELGNLDTLRKLEEQIGSLDPRRRAKVMDLLTGAEDDGEGDLEDHFDAAFGEGRRPQRSVAKPASKEERELLARLDYLEKGMQAFAAREMSRIKEEQSTSLSSQVDQEMSQYPLFKQNAVAASLAKDSIMAMLAADSAAAPDKVVRSAAGRLQDLLNQRQQQMNEESGVPRTMVQPEQKKVLNAQGLKSGAVRRLAESFLSRSQT